MLLADLGNTRGKFYDLEKGRLSLLGHWDYTENPREILGANSKHSMLFASVASSQVNLVLLNEAEGLSISCQQIKTPAYGFGVINGYCQPEKLGVDRWLALVGARGLTQAPCLIVDAGTAMTIDVMDEFGQHKGGWIIPGLKLMTDALLKKTAALQHSAPEAYLSLAHETGQAITNGALAALTGAIKESLHMAQVGLKTRFQPQVLLTGGAAKQLSPYLTVHHSHQPDLVLRGLIRYAGHF